MPRLIAFLILLLISSLATAEVCINASKGQQLANLYCESVYRTNTLGAMTEHTGCSYQLDASSQCVVAIYMPTSTSFTYIFTDPFLMLLQGGDVDITPLYELLAVGLVIVCGVAGLVTGILFHN